MIAKIDKARQRFNLEHAPLGVAQTKLQEFLEKQLDAKGRVRSYGTQTNPSQQLKNKLGQAGTIPGGLLTLSVESRAIHDRAVKSLVEDWASNAGWPKRVACVGIVHPADDGWRLATIVEWVPSRFPDLVRKRLFPDVTVVQAMGSPAAGSSVEKHGARVFDEGSRLLIKQTRYHEGALDQLVEDGPERRVDLNDDVAIANAVRDAVRGRL